MFWYEEEIKRLELIKAALTYQPEVIFYGSSSIRLWQTLETDFEEYAPLNLGFGGSTLAACAWFFERIFASLRPKTLIIYAGDNDLGDGRNPEEVFLFYKQLISLVRQNFGNIPIGFISVKPSLSRWMIIDKIQYTNKLIAADIKRTDGNISFINVYDSMMDKTGYPKREYLESEGLHINEKGYRLWKEIILDYLNGVEGNLEKQSK